MKATPMPTFTATMSTAPNVSPMLPTRPLTTVATRSFALTRAAVERRRRTPYGEDDGGGVLPAREDDGGGGALPVEKKAAQEDEPLWRGGARRPAATGWRDGGQSVRRSARCGGAWLAPA
uniref:Uncharacterized protein n=1 Tax=Arundo donax TaxID=35708 RepID=A0A0A8ZPG7_ARUDO